MSDSNAAVAQPAGSTSTSSDNAVTPYAVRAIDVEFALGKNSGTSGNSSKISLKGLRCSVTIEHAQIPDPGANAIVHIYGMSLDHMNQLSKAGLMWNTSDSLKNEMMISAGDQLTGMTTVFRGIIQEAYPDFRSLPDTSFFVRASPGPVMQLKPVAPLSYPGAVDAATAFGTMAKNAGLTLENNGVSVQLASPYFPGTTFDQIVAAARAANVYASIDSVSGVLAIWPKTGSRSDTVTISPETGMIGYPQFSAAQVTVRSLFTPQVRQLTKGPGQKINIKSQLKAANGIFNTSQVTLQLESQKPGGAWEMIVTAYPKGYGQSG